MPPRRRLLGVAAAALAGCLGPATGTPRTGTYSPTPQTDPDSPTPTTESAAGPQSYALGETHETTAGEPVTVSDADVHVSIVSRHVAGSSTHPDVGLAGRGQFLVVDHDPIDPASFGIRIDGERIGRERYEPIGPDEGRTAFAVPLVDAHSAAVVWVGGDDPVRWELPAAVVRDFGARPRFEVETFDVPDAISPGEPIDVTLRVTNVGDRDGRFLAELGAVVISDFGEVWFDVPRGETVERHFSLIPPTYTPMYGAGEDELPVVLDWGADRLKKTVRLVSESPTEG